MHLSEAVIPISEMKSHTARLVNGVAENRRPVIITQNGRARVIVEDLRTYEETQESLAMLKVLAMGRQNVQDGKFKPVSQAFADVRNHLLHHHSR
jgi:prevent-host-death family protein